MIENGRRGVPDSLHSGLGTLSETELMDPPEALRNQCLPVPGETSGTRLLTRRDTLWLRARGVVPTGLRLAVVLIVGVAAVSLWDRPYATPLASAEILQEAISSLGTVTGIHITTEVDSGEETTLLDRWEIWSVLDLGIRDEHFGFVSIYNEKKRKRYEYDKTSAKVTITEHQETGIGREFLRRGRQDENLQYLLVKACDSSPDFTDEDIVIDGQLIRRLSCRDDRGYPIIVDLDPFARRILRTESRLCRVENNETEPRRVITRYEHLESGDVDASFFELDWPAVTEVVVTPPDFAAKRQCLTNLRDLVYVLMLYEEDHANALPGDVEQAIRSSEGFRESSLHCPLVQTNGKLQYWLNPDALKAKSIWDLPPDTVIFECILHEDSAVRSYADGHSAVVGEED